MVSHSGRAPPHRIEQVISLCRGHGTRIEDGRLIATVSGYVERVNKLVSVRPLNARYTGEVGDVVVGRIVDVGDKRWRVDINARQDAVLHLSSIILPGGAQRRRTSEDSLQMRSFYSEGDLVSVRFSLLNVVLSLVEMSEEKPRPRKYSTQFLGSELIRACMIHSHILAPSHSQAEVQAVHHDGSVSLHTRSMKYGKLDSGQLVCVPQVRTPPICYRRAISSHFVVVQCVIALVFY
jgi:exosome complex component RRP4